jgi:hypothetical protein
LFVQYNYLHTIYQVVLMAIQLVSVLVELIRPYLGYYGNLAEKVWICGNRKEEFVTDSRTLRVLDAELDFADANNFVFVLQSGDSSTTTGALCVHDTFCFVGS